MNIKEFFELRTHCVICDKELINKIDYPNNYTLVFDGLNYRISKNHHKKLSGVYLQEDNSYLNYAKPKRFIVYRMCPQCSCKNSPDMSSSYLQDMQSNMCGIMAAIILTEDKYQISLVKETIKTYDEDRFYHFNINYMRKTSYIYTASYVSPPNKIFTLNLSADKIRSIKTKEQFLNKINLLGLA
jgi:hypothetical protein